MAEELIFNWTGTNRSGKKLNGEMKAVSIASVKAVLKKQGITAKTVKKQGKSLFSMGAKITPADIAIFTRQLATMMKAGVP
ncbi:MAG: type II secretion system F family protein, partial [Pseudomonadales bacterium]